MNIQRVLSRQRHEKVVKEFRNTVRKAQEQARAEASPAPNVKKAIVLSELARLLRTNRLETDFVKQKQFFFGRMQSCEYPCDFSQTFAPSLAK